MRGFKQEIFNQKTLEELYQTALQEEKDSITLSSKKQYTVWARSKHAGKIDISYQKAKEYPTYCIGVYKTASVYLNIQPQASKFNSKKVKADGYTFDSKSEYEFYLKLKADPEVRITAVHPSFELMAGFRDNKGYWHRAITYEADFSYYRGGILHIVDVKGLALPEFRLKWKLFVHKMGAIDPEIVCLAINAKGVDIFSPPQKKRKVA